MTEDLRTIQVGAATVTIINVGDVQEDLNNWFALSEAERAHHADLLAKPARFPIQCIHIAMPGVSVLVDAGLYDYPPDAPQLIPGYQPPLDLFAGLAQRQIKLDEIQQVIITHAHGDHFNALTALRGLRSITRARSTPAGPTIERPGSILSGIGLYADLDRKRLMLKDQVHGRFEPRMRGSR